LYLLLRANGVEALLDGRTAEGKISREIRRLKRCIGSEL